MIHELIQIVDFVVRQVSSGRWILTIAATVILIHWAWVLPSDKIDKLLDIVKDIVIFYFVMRPNVEQKPNGKIDNSDPIETKSLTETKP